MPLTPAVFTSSQSLGSSGGLVQTIEVVPDGGSLDVRILKGTDTTGTVHYRIRAQEKSEFRDFTTGGGLQVAGPLYLYIYEGSGHIIVTT